LKKKFPIWFLAMIMTLALQPAAYADVGPKPLVVIDFQGLENEWYYVTLLSEIPTTGPYRAIEAYPGNPRFSEEEAD